MGYQTNYSIDIFGEFEINCGHNFPNNANFCPECGKANKPEYLNEKVEYLIEEHIGYNPFEDICKWYDHDEDMKKFSKKYPGTVFVLSGEGEESGDIWKKYYRAGKVQACNAKITFDEYDESKLV